MMRSPILICALAAVLIGCASIAPRDISVTWTTACSNGPQTRLIRVVDTQVPTLDCIRAAPPADAGLLVALALVGVPVAACVITVGDRATVYAPITAGPVQTVLAASALLSPEELVEHEIAHVFGMAHPLLAPWLGSCI